jgi:hypothetical protein
LGRRLRGRLGKDVDDDFAVPDRNERELIALDGDRSDAIKVV